MPTHTVNMTTLRDTNDIWKSHSIAPHEVRSEVYVGVVGSGVLTRAQEPSDILLKEFLITNEGKRCVVVLDVRPSLFLPDDYLLIESVRKSRRRITRRSCRPC